MSGKAPIKKRLNKQRLTTEWHAFKWALGLLTRIPVKFSTPTEPNLAGYSLHWYAAVGGVIALILALLGLAIGGVSSQGEGLLGAVLLITCWIWISGGLHLDGLADTADAWVGGMGNRDRTLEIMKDPASGPVAVVTLVLVILLKTAALHSLLIVLPGTANSQWLWCLVPLLARTVLPLAFVSLPYVRSGGMAEGMIDHASRKGIYLALFGVLLLVFLMVPLILLLSWLLTGIVVFLLWRRAMLNRLQGFTGDTAGALIELLETALLVVAALLISPVSGALL